MNTALEARAKDILVRYPARSLSLPRLHELLVAELGTAAGTYHDLQAKLRQSEARFLILEPRDPLAASTDWPAEVRSAYTREITRLPGQEPLVTLTDPFPSATESPLAALHRTLCDLRDANLGAPDLFWEMGQLDVLLTPAEPSTTPPPPLRPER